MYFSPYWKLFPNDFLMAASEVPPLKTLANRHSRTGTMNSRPLIIDNSPAWAWWVLQMSITRQRHPSIVWISIARPAGHVMHIFNSHFCIWQNMQFAAAANRYPNPRRRWNLHGHIEKSLRVVYTRSGRDEPAEKRKNRNLVFQLHIMLN